MVEMSSNVHLTDKNTSNGFLSGFIESCVEMPADGLNGECIIHYGGEHSNCELNVRLSKGLKEGVGTILKDGVPFIQIEYDHGVPNGPVCRMDDFGVVDMRGELMNGVESGLFEEYDRSKRVVWRGYYRNGQRYSEVRNRVANQDDSNGEFYELDENGNVTQLCLYENGERSRVIQEYIGSTMIEYDENGKKVYEGGFKGDMENGFVRDGFGKEYIVVEESVKSVSEPREESEKKRFCCWVRRIEHEVPKMEYVSTTYREKAVAFGHWKNGKKNGVICDLDEDGEMKRVVEEWELSLMLLSMRNDNCLIDYMESASLFVTDTTTGTMHGVLQSNNRYFSVDWLENDSQSIMVDMDSKEMIVYRNGERVDTQCAEEVIDLDINGRRWEGRMMEGQPFGYGVIYDEEGRKEYEGFMIDGMKTCYGIEYYSDIERMKYEGCYNNDMRFGIGILYGRNGVVEYDDLWKDDEPYSSLSDGRTIDNHTESIAIPNKSFNESKSFIPLFFLHSLKRIVIGNECFGMVRSFELDGLTELESVVIGQYDFRISNSKRSDGTCRIVNCPKLKSIQIGDYSFSDYHSFELNFLPSLQSIDIGERCFCWSPSFSLTGIFD